MLGKQLVTQVLTVNLIWKIRTAVCVFFCILRRNQHFSVFCAHIGIVQRIDVYGTSIGVIGELRLAGYGSVVETGGIVVRHGQFVVCIVLINQPYLLNGILVFIQFAENIQQILRNRLIADKFSLLNLRLKIIVQNMDVSQRIIRNLYELCCVGIGLPCNARLEFFCQTSRVKSGVCVMVCILFCLYLCLCIF